MIPRHTICNEIANLKCLIFDLEIKQKEKDKASKIFNKIELMGDKMEEGLQRRKSMMSEAGLEKIYQQTKESIRPMHVKQAEKVILKALEK